MSDDPDMWNQRGTLTLGHDETGGAEVPPLPDEIAEPRPLRDILGRFVDAAPAEREHFTRSSRTARPFRRTIFSSWLRGRIRRFDNPFYHRL